MSPYEYNADGKENLEFIPTGRDDEVIELQNI